MRDRVVINKSLRKSIQKQPQAQNKYKQHLSSSFISQNFQQNNPKHSIYSINSNNNSNYNQNKLSQTYFSLLKRQKENYRHKQQQAQNKANLLYKIIQENGLIQEIPNTFIKELSYTNKRIYQIQQIISDKNYSAIKILQKQILIFLEDIGFQVPQKVFEKITTQIEMINFILQLFSHRYQELINQKTQLEQFIRQFRQNQQSVEKYHENQTLQLKMEIQEILKKYRQQQQQLYQLRQNISQRQRYLQIQLKNSIMKSNFKQLETKNNILQQRLQDLTQKFTQKELQNRKLIAFKEQIQNQFEDSQLKIQVLQNELGRMQRQQVRWKQRYQGIFDQKNERIKILEKMLNQRYSSSNIITQSQQQEYHNYDLPQSFR